MKTMIFAAVAALALSTAPAMAQDRAITEVGVTAGAIGGDTSFGARVGLHDFNLPYGVQLEGTYDGTEWQDTVGVNAVKTVPLTDRFAAYGLVGLGYDWNDNRGDRGTWAYGGGMTYALTETIGVDARVRVINALEDSSDDTAYTVGLNYKF